MGDRESYQRCLEPSRGVPYYLFDRDGDGIVDNDTDGVAPVYFKLFEWN